MINLKTQITQLKLAATHSTTASTAHSSANSRASQVPPHSKTASYSGVGSPAIRDIAVARYHKHCVSEMLQCDQIDWQLFPETRAMQAAPDYAQDIYNHLRRQESAEPGLYTAKAPAQDSQPPQA